MKYKRCALLIGSRLSVLTKAQYGGALLMDGLQKEHLPIHHIFTTTRVLLIPSAPPPRAELHLQSLPHQPPLSTSLPRHATVSSRLPASSPAPLTQPPVE